MKSVWWFLFHPREARFQQVILESSCQELQRQVGRIENACAGVLLENIQLEDKVAALLRNENRFAASTFDRIDALRKALGGISTYLDRPTVIRSARNGAVLCSVKDVRILIHEAAAALEADDLERAG